MSQTVAASVKYAGRTYIFELCLTMGLYVGAIAARPWLAAHASSPELAAAAKALPALPIWLAFAAIWRYYRRIDEFERLKFLKTLALAFGLGSCAIVTYSFLEDAGLPPLALTWAWPTLAVSWALTSALLSFDKGR